ncbi:hypothetical protein [Taibaiella helva]|uniref:hypothetical protein n=1 Tax=Taibaiella helva TaxID=2301235 RepID=UPI000E587959|nr:hypothetical protein [Taibaiella helva]
MKSKFFIKFLNNSSHLDSDLEFVDIIKSCVINGRTKTDLTDFLFDYVDPSKHKRFSTGANSDHRRKLAVNHLKASIRSAFIKSIYEATTTYFQEVLKAATKKGVNSDRLLGEHNRTYTSKEIIELGNYSKILESIASSIFRQLENEKKTKDLILKMGKKLGLDIDETKINAALPFFELRHKLVHSEGKADKAFCDRFPEFGAVVDRPIKLTHTLIEDAKTAIVALITDFDTQIIAKSIISQTEMQP